MTLVVLRMQCKMQEHPSGKHIPRKTSFSFFHKLSEAEQERSVFM